jgi:hypothetical protein
LFVLFNLLLNFVEGIVKRIVVEVKLNRDFFFKVIVLFLPVLMNVYEFDSNLDAYSKLTKERNVDVVCMLKDRLFVFVLNHYLMGRQQILVAIIL